MRFEIVIEDILSNVSTPWQASVMEIDTNTDEMAGQVQAVGYGSTPQAAAAAAVEDWKEQQ